MKTASKPSKAISKPKRAKSGDCARGSFSISIEADGDAAVKGVTKWTIRRRANGKSQTWSPIRLEFKEPANGAAVFAYVMSQRNQPGWSEYSHFDVLPTPDPRNEKDHS